MSRERIRKILEKHLTDSGLTPLPMFEPAVTEPFIEDYERTAHVTSREISPPYNIPHGNASYSNESGWVRWSGLNGNGEYKIEKGLQV